MRERDFLWTNFNIDNGVRKGIVDYGVDTFGERSYRESLRDEGHKFRNTEKDCVTETLSRQ